VVCLRYRAGQSPLEQGSAEGETPVWLVLEACMLEVGICK